MSKEKRRVPKLRFPGFTEDWEQYRFNNLLKKNLERNDGKFNSNKTISIARMKYNKLGNGASDESLNNYKVLRFGDIAFEGHENKEFKYGRFVMNDIGDGIMSPRFTALRPIKVLDVEFWKEYINYEPIMQKKLVNSTKKGTMMHELVVDEFLKQEILLPSKEEQQKIGRLLKLQSNIINLHQRKVEHLILKKKALLQKLFPRNGNRYPDFRFPGFTAPWEQCKLGDVANIKTGSRNQQDSVTNGKYPFFIRSEKIEKLDTYDFDTEAILVPGDGRIGEIFHYYKGKFALHQRVYKVDDFKGVDAFYLLYLFQCKFKEHALRLNAQGTVPSLRLPMFTEWNISRPSLQEQICIGRLLNKIELMITLHQRKLEHLQIQKKSLLQQLFV